MLARRGKQPATVTTAWLSTVQVPPTINSVRHRRNGAGCTGPTAFVGTAAGDRGQRCRGVRGHEEPPESPEEQRNTKWKRLFNAVVAVQNRLQDGRPLIRLVLEVIAPVRFASQAEFDATRALVNEKLLLTGFSVRDDGKVIRVAAASTVAEAQARADGGQQGRGQGDGPGDAVLAHRPAQ